MKTIYILCYAGDIRQVSDVYVTHEEDIKQLAIDHYWGILTKPVPGRLTVIVDMAVMTVTILDNKAKTTIKYDILAFERKP